MGTARPLREHVHTLSEPLESESIEYTPEPGQPHTTTLRFSGSDGFDYIVETVVRGTDDRDRRLALEHDGWRFLSGEINVVEHRIVDVRFARKYPGPVVTNVWRRARPVRSSGLG